MINFKPSSDSRFQKKRGRCHVCVISWKASWLIKATRLWQHGVVSVEYMTELPMHAPLVTSGSQGHLCFLCLLYTFALPKRIWPGKVSCVVSSVSVDISLIWTISNSFTIIALLERGSALFVSTELVDMVGRVPSGYTLSRWRSLRHSLPLMPLIEPHLKQWKQLSTPAVLHELLCRRRNCDWLPDA